MARAELASPAEPDVIVTLSKREAALLSILSGHVNEYDQPGTPGSELYALLEEIGRPYGLSDYLDAERFLDLEVSGCPSIKIETRSGDWD